MKRSNFTFLFLFAFVSFFAGRSYAQDNTCVGELNVTVSGDCMAFVSADFMPMGTDTILIKGAGIAATGSGIAPGEPFPMSGPLGTISDGRYTYEAMPASGETPMCWGYLNFEFKYIPDYDTWTGEVCCIEEDDLEWPDVELPEGCWAPYDLITPTVVKSVLPGDGCDTTIYVRTSLAKFDVEGGSIVDTVRLDTIKVDPIDLKEDVCAPTEEVVLSCDILDETGGDYSPAALAAAYAKEELRSFDIYANSRQNFVDTMFYPYLKKETDLKYDIIYYCAAKQKFLTGDTVMTAVIDKVSGEEVWVAVPEVDYFCVEEDYTFILSGANYKCEDFSTAIVTDSSATDTFRIQQYLDNCFKFDYEPDVPEYVKLDKGNTCNVNAKYTDMELEGQCGLPMIMRTWNLINWCDKSDTSYQQWIIFEDTDAPYLDLDSKERGPQLTTSIALSTEPWVCYGEVDLTVPFRSSCGILEWSWSTSEGTVKSDGNTATVSNLWATEGYHTVTATAYNECNGKSTTATFWVYVSDRIAPVAVAEDYVSVTLTDGGSFSEGIAKVTVEAIDAGSHDAGCGEVDACLLLEEEWANPVYVPAWAYFSEDDGLDGKSTSRADGQAGSVPLQVGYLPLQCGDPDLAIHYYSADKFGVLHYAGVTYANVCEDFVKFCCENKGENRVALVVNDNNGSESYVSSGYDEGLIRAYGNVSYSWAVVNVEDKSGPGWSDCYFDEAPECDEVGTWVPTYKPNYGGAYCPSEYDVRLIGRDYNEACGNVDLFLTYGAYDANDSLVSTFVCDAYNLYTDAPFDPTTIKWPLHYTRTTLIGAFTYQEADAVVGWNVECYDKDEDGKVEEGEIFERSVPVWMNAALECVEDVQDEPVWCDATCALIAYSYEDLEAEASDACKKVLRTHTVIDWCTYEPNAPGKDDNDTFVAYSDWTTGEACDDCDHYSVATDDVPVDYFAYDDVDVDGYYTFVQVIKVVDNDAATILVDEEYVVDITSGASAKGDDFDDCENSGVVIATAADVCADSEVDGSTITWWIEVLDANDRNKVIATKSDKGMEVSMSTQIGSTDDEYIIVWKATDGCGNISEARTIVTFADTKNPTPVCLQDISTATMNVDGSSVAIWASDYDLGSFDNCSEVDVYFKDSLGNSVTSMSFSCDDIANGISATQELQLYVADESGNEDFCYVTLRIDDNADICPDVDGQAAALIAGEVRTELGDMVESAKVSLNKANTDITSVEGKYAFANTPMYNAYEVTSKKDDDYLNGVTTLDLVLIQKHVLGIEALDSPYKVIAADINSDAKISGADLVDLRKLILGVYTELPSNDSWRFVDAAQSFDDVANPFPFTEALTVNLDAEALNQDFIAAKIGDVSGNAIANSLIAAGTRSAGTLNLEISDAAVAAGNTVSVAVTAANFSEIAAYQFTMDVAGLEFTGVEAGAINVSADNFAALDANTVTTAWFSAEAVSTSDVLFTMNFTATADVNLSEALAVSSRVTQAAAYNANAEKLDINVAYNGVASSEFALYQNEPNPFDQTTTVAFELAQAGAATLTVFDVTGKTVSVVKGDFNKGYNTITLDKSDLNASGVLYYQLESGSFTATKKMVVIE